MSFTPENIPHSLGVMFEDDEGTRAIVASNITFLGEHPQGYHFVGLIEGDEGGTIPVEAFLNLSELDEAKKFLSKATWKENKDADVLLAEHSTIFSALMFPHLSGLGVHLHDNTDLRVENIQFLRMERASSDMYHAIFAGTLSSSMDGQYPVQAIREQPVSEFPIEDEEGFPHTVYKWFSSSTWNISVTELTVGQYVKNEWEHAPLNGSDFVFYYRGNRVDSIKTATDDLGNGTYEIQCTESDETTHIMYAQGTENLFTSQTRSWNNWILSPAYKKKVASALIQLEAVQEANNKARKLVDEQVSAYRESLELEHKLEFALETTLSEELEQMEQDVKAAWKSEWMETGQNPDGKESPDKTLYVSERPNLEYTSEKLLIQWLIKNNHESMYKQTVVKTKLLTAWKDKTIETPPGVKPVTNFFPAWRRDKIVELYGSPSTPEDES